MSNDESKLTSLIYDPHLIHFDTRLKCKQTDFEATRAKSRRVKNQCEKNFEISV